MEGASSESEGLIDLAETFLIGSIGKLLVRKGIIDRAELIGEMLDARRSFEGKEGAAYQLACREIDSVVRAVERWQ